LRAIFFFPRWTTAGFGLGATRMWRAFGGVGENFGKGGGDRRSGGGAGGTEREVWSSPGKCRYATGWAASGDAISSPATANHE